MNKKAYDIVLGNLLNWNPCALDAGEKGSYELMALAISDEIKRDSSIDDISWLMYSIIAHLKKADRNRCNEYATYIWLKMQAVRDWIQ